MGTYIKNMEKPQDCVYCEFEDCGYCRAIHSHIEVEYGRPDDVIDPRCPLIEIKAPHGRLIDVDEHFREIKSHWCAGCVNYPRGCGFCKVTVYEDMMDAPTVIEAEVE